MSALRRHMDCTESECLVGDPSPCLLFTVSQGRLGHAKEALNKRLGNQARRWPSGVRLLSVRDEEPPHGSVLMRNSPTGTAFQRHFNDGLYHGTNGKVMTYRELFSNAAGAPDRTTEVYLIYTAPLD